MNLDGPIIDTNVVIRLLRSEDKQHPDAVRLLEETRLGGRQLVLLDVVVAECVYVLTSHYKIDRARIADSLAKIIEHKAIGVATPEILRDALGRFSMTKMHFVDCYLAAMAKAAGREVVTFDRGFAAFGDVKTSP
jgi:predicted nucleic-acid-binding protein